MEKRERGRPKKEDAKRKIFNLSGVVLTRLDELVKEEKLKNPKATETQIVEKAIMSLKIP